MAASSGSPSSRTRARTWARAGAAEAPPEAAPANQTSRVNSLITSTGAAVAAPDPWPSGAGAAKKPSPGSIRPVPNGLFMPMAQATALASLSTTAKAVPDGGASGASGGP